MIPYFQNCEYIVYLLLPDWWKLLGLLVVASKTVDPALNKNQPKLGILIFPVPFQMLADSNCFLDQVVQILRNLRSKTFINRNNTN